jgi:hypothetical protein
MIKMTKLWAWNQISFKWEPVMNEIRKSDADFWLKRFRNEVMPNSTLRICSRQPKPLIVTA